LPIKPHVRAIMNRTEPTCPLGMLRQAPPPAAVRISCLLPRRASPPAAVALDQIYKIWSVERTTKDQKIEQSIILVYRI